MLAVIGDQFDECVVEGGGASLNGSGNGNGGGEAGVGQEEGVWPEICGCTISVRQNEDIITVWNKTDGNAKVKEKIRYGRLFSHSILSFPSFRR